MKKIFVLLVTSLTMGIHAQDLQLLDTKSTGSGMECLMMGPDKEKLITGHLDGYLYFWDANTFEIIGKSKDRVGTVYSILFNSTGTQFVTAGDGGTVGVYEYPSCKLLYNLQVPCDHNSFAVFSNDGNTIYFGGHDNDRKYNSNTGRYGEPYAALWRVPNTAGGRSEIAFVDEGLYTSSNSITDGNIDYTGTYIVYTRNSELMFYDVSAKHFGFKVSVPGILNNLTPVKDKIYVWGDKYLYLMELENGKYMVKNKVLAGTRNGNYGYSKMVLSENGKWLVTGDDNSDVNIWDPKTLQPIQKIKGHTDLVRTFVFCKNDSVLLTAGYDGKLMIWGQPVPPKDTVPVVQDVVFADNNIPVSIKEREVELQSTISVSQPEFDIQIWDRSVVDGDSISLNLNGEWILQEYMVVKTKNTIHVKINPDSPNNYLILFAHNLGEISPNTAAIQFVVDGKEYKLTLTSDLKKSGALNFAYKPK